MSSNPLLHKAPKPQDFSGDIKGAVLLASGSKPINLLKEYDWYLNVHTFYSDHFDDKRLSGFDEYVQGTIYSFAHEAILGLKSLIIVATKEVRYLDQGLGIMLYCSVGARCSVAVVELLAQELKSARINTLTYHKELDKWLKY
jgi:RNase adaptor protein for sRNA GlmZ degradation